MGNVARLVAIMAALPIAAASTPPCSAVTVSGALGGDDPAAVGALVPRGSGGVGLGAMHGSGPGPAAGAVPWALSQRDAATLLRPTHGPAPIVEVPAAPVDRGIVGASLPRPGATPVVVMSLIQAPLAPAPRALALPQRDETPLAAMLLFSAGVGFLLLGRPFRGDRGIV
ncbi:MAG: hypothetical protein AAF677_07280 [Pseudomonadota bacterium]